LRRPTAPLWIVLASLALSPTPADAAVVVTDAGAFAIAIDAGDAVSVDCSGGFVRVFDDGAPTTYTTLCAAVTSLTVTATGAFDNTVNLSGVTATAFTSLPLDILGVLIFGGPGADVLTGSELPDDFVGGPGNDIMVGGPGSDRFDWNNEGDGSDTVQGGAGSDIIFFFDPSAAEVFTLSADGTGFDFTRDVGSIVMDVETVESFILLAPVGGRDSVTVGNLTGVADLTEVNLFMGDGDDTVNAATQANSAIRLQILGDGGTDNLIGSPVAETILGGFDDDVIAGLGGIDILAGDEGNDTFIWNPGDGSDTILGGAGHDTLRFNGSAAAEAFGLTPDVTGFDFTRDVGNIVMDVEGVEVLALAALGGNDSLTVGDLAGVANLVALDVQMGDGDDTANASAQTNPGIELLLNGDAGNDDLTGTPSADFIFGGAGNDSITGLAGVDIIDGGEGDDTIVGGPGNEQQIGRDGNDTFIWNPGDGSDFLLGELGADTLIFNGSAANEIFSVTWNGTTFLFTRDVGNIVMEADSIETLTLNALAGNDSATVNNLTGKADLTAINLVMGDGDDTVTAAAQANAAIALVIDGGAGNDNLTGSPNADAINGGAGNDTIVGLGGVDLIDGGDGNDTITGGPGSETRLGGGGDDTFIWNPGDGSDTLVGGTGADTMVFNGSAGNEVFATTAQGAGFRFTRDVGNIVMNATEVEAITLNALGGDDNVTTVPLTGTSQNLIGGTQTTADVLVLDAAGGCVTPSGAGTVTVTGAQPITFSEFELVNVTNQCVPDVPTLGPLALAAMAAFLALVGLLVMRLQSSG
jgi:Ca2+-binding RTX toxin-like protein